MTSGLPNGTSDYCFEDRRSQASQRVNHVKMLVAQLSNHRQRKLKKILAQKLIIVSNLTSSQKVLKYIFESRLSIDYLEEISGIHRDIIKTKCKEVAKVIFNYYEN